MRTNPEFLARVAAAAAASGVKTAAAKPNITTKTVIRYRARATADPELAAIVPGYIHSCYRRWTAARDRFLAVALDKLTVLAQMASSLEQLTLVASAYQTVGELQLASAALNVDSNRAEPCEAIPRAARLGAAAGALPPRR